MSAIHMRSTSSVGAGLLLIALSAGVVRAQAMDPSTVQLQQDVMQLRQENQRLEQRVQQLERAVAGQSGLAVPPIAPNPPGGLGRVPGTGGAAVSGNDAQGALPRLPWLENANWDRIKPGMPELDVIRILGVPNSLRDAGAGRITIFYAIEIGTARFLSGSVTLADHRVAEIQRPTLK